jgi:phosphoglycerate dehydrogenase-like enzyme
LEDLQWKAYIVYTNLDSLTGFSEKIGPLRNFEPSHTRWAADRETTTEFAGAEEDQTKSPKVLLIGAGQSGLSIAARLKAMDISALVIDKNERIGDSWRGRYDSLSLHDPVCKSTSI